MSDSSAFGYLRTSSTANVGDTKDSETRQRTAIERYAAANKITVRQWFYDAAVSGADPIQARPGFAAMLSALAGNGTRMVLVETANRFARDLIVAETGYAYLRDLGIALVPVDEPQHFHEETPTSRLVRQVLGAIAEWEKAMLVAKLKGARDRKRQREGRCEGRKPAPREARDIARDLKGRGYSLRSIAVTLAASGYLAPSGKPYGPQSIACML